MDELSTDSTSEGSDEFQGCDGEEFEDWTSEADRGHQLMRNFPSHCIGRRIEIRQSKRVRDEQSELEESIVHEHHESGNCTYKDEQTYCSRSIARERVELRAELVQQHLPNKRKEPSDKDGKPSKAAKAKSATNKLPTKASTEARDPITLEKCLQVAGALLHAFGRLLPHCLQILTVQQWQTLSFTFSATSRHHHLPPGLQRYVCLKLSLSFLFLSVSLSLSLPLFALSLSVASRAASSMRRCTTVSFSPIRCIFRKSRLKRTSLDLTGSLA
eukprot:s2008_g2.t1